jgi:HD superfamily phosphodiesterase
MMRLLTGCMIAVALAVPAQAETWRDKVTAFASENLHHPAWGASHSRRDYALAKSLAAADGVTLDDDVLFAAAFLHDMSAFAAWKIAGTDHSDAAAQKIDLVLGGTDFPADKLEAVRAAIRTHMFYRDPVAPEARYLHDADALDWLGAIGIARQFAMVGDHGTPPLGPDAVRALQGNMTAVPPRIVTPAGKAAIAPRLAEENAFLDALKRESGDLADL